MQVHPLRQVRSGSTSSLSLAAPSRMPLVPQNMAPNNIIPRRRGSVSTIRRSAVLEETYTISFETIYQLNRQVQGGSSLSISFDDFYRVVLHYTQWVDDDPIAQKVKRAVPKMTMNEAIRIVDSARRYGSSIVVTASLEDATRCKDILTRSQLKASIELA